MHAYRGLFSNSFIQSKFGETYELSNSYLDFMKKLNILSLELKLNYEFESIILSYGENFKVLEPQKLVGKIKKRVQEMNNFY